MGKLVSIFSQTLSASPTNFRSWSDEISQKRGLVQTETKKCGEVYVFCFTYYLIFYDFSFFIFWSNKHRNNIISLKGSCLNIQFPETKCLSLLKRLIKNDFRVNSCCFLTFCSGFWLAVCFVRLGILPILLNLALKKLSWENLYEYHVQTRSKMQFLLYNFQKLIQTCLYDLIFDHQTSS